MQIHEFKKLIATKMDSKFMSIKSLIPLLYNTLILNSQSNCLSCTQMAI
jgi:hypothetical protein